MDDIRGPEWSNIQSIDRVCESFSSNCIGEMNRGQSKSTVIFNSGCDRNYGIDGLVFFKIDTTYTNIHILQHFYTDVIHVQKKFIIRVIAESKIDRLSHKTSKTDRSCLSGSLLSRNSEQDICKAGYFAVCGWHPDFIAVPVIWVRRIGIPNKERIRLDYFDRIGNQPIIGNT